MWYYYLNYKKYNIKILHNLYYMHADEKDQLIQEIEHGSDLMKKLNNYKNKSDN